VSYNPKGVPYESGHVAILHMQAAYMQVERNARDVMARDTFSETEVELMEVAYMPGTGAEWLSDTMIHACCEAARVRGR